MAAETDGAVLVVRHGKTTRDQVTGAVDRLDAVGSAPLGVIFNMIPNTRSGHYGYGYGYGYAPEPEDRRDGKRNGKKGGRREPAGHHVNST